MEDTKQYNTDQDAAATNQDTNKQEEAANNGVTDTPSRATDAGIINPSLEERIKKFLSNTFVLAIIVAICVLIIGDFFKNYASDLGNELTEPLVEIANNQSNTDDLSIGLSTIEKKKIGSLNQIINMHKQHHKLTFLMMYKFHYANITFLALFSILTAAIVFLIGQKGWNNSEHITKRLFIIFASFAAFYGVSINIYQQRANIQNNLDAYLHYDNLQKDIYYFSLSDPYIVEKETINFNEFFISTSATLHKLNQIYLQFDETAASSTKIEIPGN